MTNSRNTTEALAFTRDTRVVNTQTSEIGIVMHAPYSIWMSDLGRQMDVMNIRYDNPRRGYSPQRDEFVSVHVLA